MEVSFAATTQKQGDVNAIAKERLQRFDLQEDFLKVMDAQLQEDLCRATEISVKKQYYVEDAAGNMLPKPRAEYEAPVLQEKVKQEQATAAYEQALSNQNAGIAPLRAISETVDRGTLMITFMVVGQGGRKYHAAALCAWTTMPSARHTDAFVIVRQATTSVDPYTARGSYYYQYKISYQNGAPTNEYTSPAVEIPYASLKRPSDGMGYAMEIKMPKDTQINQYPYTRVTNTALIAGISYKGEVNNDSVLSINHFAPYAHKKIKLVWDGIDFSVPFAVGFSVSIAWTWIQIMGEHTWYR